MKRICCAIALGSRCSHFAMSAMQDPKKKLTKAAIDGATFARSVGMWEGQVRDHPAFAKVRKALLDLAAAQQKQGDK